MDLRNFYTLVAIDQQIIFRYRFTAADAQRLGLKYPLVNAQGIQIVRNSPNAPRSFEIFQEYNGNPYSLQWTADIQRQIGNDAVLQVGYVGTRGVRILLTHNINNPDRLTGQRPVPSVAISNLRDAGDSSTYHGLRRLSVSASRMASCLTPPILSARRWPSRKATISAAMIRKCRTRPIGRKIGGL